MRDTELDLLPFAAQCALIDDRIAGDCDVAGLLAALGALRDHQPLAHAVCRLAEAGKLDHPAVAAAIADLFVTVADTGIQCVLRAVDTGDLAGDQLAVLVRGVTAAVQSLPLERLAAVCLMDRWLKNHASDARDAIVAQAAVRVEKVMTKAQTSASAAGGSDGSVFGEVTDPVLLLLPGSRLTALDVPEKLHNAWFERLSQFAGRVLDILEAAPKSLSQANAEEILSRRVYTDPGHFLVELLQNAEDAGAQRFRVDITDTAVNVWHDGTQFDAKDVVGVLSIGQTTKRKDQIGFFGVGFKSVYEICSRPQIYSGPFCFEIANVSIPRRLSPRPDTSPDLAERGTLLVLELSDPDDPQRSPATLYDRVRAVPRETLLALTSLREIAVSFGGFAARVRAEEGDSAGRVRLTEELSQVSDGRPECDIEGDIDTSVAEYLVESGEFHFSGPQREAARVSHTPVLVAIALDGRGVPVPLPGDAPTVFSYLPTRERSGLRFVLHAHFDLPVDRERLDLDSSWNQWAIARAGELLGRVAKKMALSHQLSDGMVDGLLDILPLAGELAHPAYGAIISALSREARDVAILPAADGSRVAANRAAIATDPAVAIAVAGIDLDDTGRRALAPMTERREHVARSLGASDFTAPELLDLLERDLGASQDWFVAGYDAVMDYLARAIDDHPQVGERLRALPVVLDHRGELRRPDQVARANDELYAVYGDARLLVHPRIELSLAGLLDALGVARLGPRDLIADLRRPERASAIAGEELERAHRLFAYLARLPTELVAGLGGLAIYRDEHGQLRAIAQSGGEPANSELAWLRDGTSFADFTASMAGTRPALIDPVLAKDHRELFFQLGAPVLNLSAFLRLVASGDVRFGDGDVIGFHRAIAAMRGDLTPRLCAELVLAAVFPDCRGTLRPLAGDGRALVTARHGDRQLEDLAPHAPWLAAEISALPHVRALGAGTIGPAEVAADLAGSTTLGLGTAGAALHPAYRYLAGHADAIPGDSRSALAAAPIWLDVTGERHSLTALRRPAGHPILAEFYRVWSRFPLIEDAAPAGPDTGRSGWDLADALGLASQVIAPDYRTFIADLVANRDPSAIAAVYPELCAALVQAAIELPKSQLAAVTSAAIFRAEDGELYPLLSWQAPLDRVGVSRATGALREALAHGSRRLLSRQDEGAMAGVLDALGCTPAGPADLVRTVRRDPAFRDHAARHAARAALVASARFLAADLDRDTLAALRELAIWPAIDDRMLPASAVVRRGDLRGVLSSRGDDDAWTTWSDAVGDALSVAAGQYALLARSAEADADVLSDVIAFGDPIAVMIALIDQIAVVDAPLAEQPELLSDAERVAELFCLARRAADPLALPLIVDAAGRLVCGRRYRASDDELAVCRHLAIYAQLAHPRWAAVVGQHAPDLVEPISVRQIAAALAGFARSPQPVAEASFLSELEQRQALYRWLIDHRDELTRDSQARGAFARACVIATAGGFLRAPRDLLLDPDLPDLGIDWNAADEVPQALCLWLRKHVAVDEKQLVPMIEQLLSAHEQAVRESNGERSAELLGFLASCLRVGVTETHEVASLVKRFKLRKRLRVETAQRKFARPRALLAPAPERWQLLVQFADPPPPRVSARYDDARVRELICMAGAEADLDASALRPYLGVSRGDASIALAEYLALLASEKPPLRSELGLDRVAWIPNRLGDVRAADQLYWPDGDAVWVIGDRAELFPHGEFFHTAPANLTSWLPFRRAADAALSDVADHIRELLGRGEPVPVEVFDWLESGLREGRLEPRDVRDALGKERWLTDDRGDLRAPDEVVREGAHALFGHRRGTWTAGNHYPRLASALKIAKTPSKREVITYLTEIAGELDERGAAAVLNDEPDLADRLTQSWSLLATAGGKLPLGLAILAEDTRGQPTLCTAPSPVPLPDDAIALYRKAPPDLADAAIARQAPLLFAVAPASHEREVDEILARLGVPDLTAAPDEVLPEASEVRSRTDRPRSGPAAADMADTSDAPSSPEPSRQQRRRLEQRKARQERREQERKQYSEARQARRTERSPEREKRPQPEPEPEKERGSGLISRIRRWLSDDDKRRASDRDEKAGARPKRDQPEDNEPRRDRPRATPHRPGGSASRSDGPRTAGTPDHRQWFRARSRIGPQMGDNTAWAADRQSAPDFGMAFAPHSLPWPHLYGTKVIYDRFDSESQRWLHTQLDAAWSQPASEGRFRVALRGKVPAGEVLLPVPAYGHVTDIRSQPDGKCIATSSGQTVFFAQTDSEIEYSVVLDVAPNFEVEADHGSARVTRQLGHLLHPTVPDRELPAEVHASIDRIADSSERQLDRALAVRDFIRDNYYYDPAYIEDPTLGRFLANVSRGRGNAHIAAMHAGRDAKYLGRGVCYELNTLACELLRRVGVPAAIAVGWTFDRGYLDAPDHMWAVALLPTSAGPRWSPLDASTTRNGRPLHAARRPPGPWRASSRRQSAPPPRAPSWARDTARRHERGPAIPISDLVRVMRYAETLTGRTESNTAELRRRCREILATPEAAAELLRVLTELQKRGE